jgi:hypothetical protein
MTADHDATLVASTREVYAVVHEAVESFDEDDQVGPDLAYMLGAMLRGTSCARPADRPLVRILRESLPPGHAVWDHVDIDKEAP